MMQRPLQFQKTTKPPVAGDVQLELPSIEPYLPQGADVDAVDSLTSVYRSHCLLAIDNFRFCKTEKLCDSYKSLVGLLTVPGQKLLAHPQIAPWIRACDWMKYQKMIPMLDMIILTQVPAKAMAHMDHVGANLCHWISQFFQNQPRHTQDAMLGPANLFTSLLERFLRVNRAALHASKVLEDTTTRTAIWNDWVSRLEPFNVLQNSLMWHGHKRTFHILTQEARYLLDPLQDGSTMSGSRIFEDNGSRSEFQLTEMQMDNNGSSRVMIARLARFLASLVHRFPGVDARTLLNYIEVTSSNISRNLTLNGAESLHDWWRIKVFLDEMSYWLAEKGGFLDTSPEAATQRQSSWQIDSATFPFEDQSASHEAQERLPLQDKTTNHDVRQPFNGKGSFSQASHPPIHGFEGQNESLPGQSKSASAKPDADITADQEELGMMNDDSGIAMGLEEDFGMDSKYNHFVHGVHSSDPPDVVVC
jgi:regulatory factor X, other